MSRKHSYLAKLLMHSNGRVVEPGGREQRCQDANQRFNYKMSQEEGTPVLTIDEQQLLGMQPATYTVYLRNMAQTVSRNLSGVTEVITGHDTSLLGGRNAAQNYLDKRHTLPDVLLELCQGLNSKQDSAMSLIEKSLICNSHKLFKLPIESMPATDQGQRSKVRKNQEDRIVYIDQILREGQDNHLRQRGRSRKVTSQKTEEEGL